jgi:hypothetical protein
MSFAPADRDAYRVNCEAGPAVIRGSAMNKLQTIALTAALMLMTLVGIVVQAHAG